MIKFEREKIISYAQIGASTGAGVSGLIHLAEGNLPASVIDTTIGIVVLFSSKEGRHAFNEISQFGKIINLLKPKVTS